MGLIIRKPLQPAPIKCLILIVWGLSLSVPAAAQEWTGPKISGDILLHWRQKVEAMSIPGTGTEHWRQWMAADPRRWEIEECALYMWERPSVSEIADFAREGIEINPTIWVPPLAGRHPHGFCLATVPYARLEALEHDPRVIRMASTEHFSFPQNDLTRVAIGADLVHAGSGVPASMGSGVKLAIADSGVDLTHPDLPTPVETFDMTTGTDSATWSTDVTPGVDHGTHVVGTAVGSGALSGGVYRGIAPGASLYFYKIGSSTDGSATHTDQIEAVNRALAVGCQVFSMSYGDLNSTYLDGSSPVCAVIDNAVSSGMLVFIAVGNGVGKNYHQSVSLAPGATAPGVISFSIQNPASFTPYNGTVTLRVIWRDDTPTDLNVAIAGQTPASSGTSTRGTESKTYALPVTVPPGQLATFSYDLANVAASGTTPAVHVYVISSTGTPTPVRVTLSGATVDTLTIHPAVADLCVAVGAWAHRDNWIDYLGNPHPMTGYYPGFVSGARAPFSSVGPRIDGAMKPDIVCPGAAMISARDLTLGWNPIRKIDDDGINLNGSGPANYYINFGTSMASPVAAGAAALLLSVNPGLTPAQVTAALTSTASQAAAPDNMIGYGLINVATAMQGICAAPPGGLVHAITCTPGTSPLNADITFGATGGTPCSGNMVWIATTGINVGQVPNGWLYGVNITWAEMTWEIGLGAPFLGYLDPSGNYSSTITVFGLPCPLGIVLDGVALEFDVLTGAFVQGSTALTSSL